MEKTRCDVLVIGGGPAGSAAARRLAQRGVDVVLIDQHEFPRDKVCGDGLIGDALGALTTLGLRYRVECRAAASSELCLWPPRGGYAAVGGRFLCIPRRDLDLLLWMAAGEAGAGQLAGFAAVGPVEEGGRVAGARFRANGRELEVRAAVTLLATGANATALQAFGLETSAKATAAAGRAYFEAPDDVARAHRSLVIAYDRDWCPGYGWIFPVPGNRFNIGVGLFAQRSSTRRLREFWNHFISRFAPAAEIVRASKPLAPFRGAPMRTGLRDASFGRPGLLALGEAASMTYSATGEGIGKAMESGLLAADLAAECVSGSRAVDGAHVAYGDAFRASFSSRYRAYAIAERWAAHPMLLNLLGIRARRGRFVKRELEDLVSERGDARRLFSTAGLLRALVQ